MPSLGSLKTLTPTMEQSSFPPLEQLKAVRHDGGSEEAAARPLRHLQKPHTLRWTEAVPAVGHRINATITSPGETEAGSAGKQPCRGITWRAHPDDEPTAGRGRPRPAANTHRRDRPAMP